METASVKEIFDSDAGEYLTAYEDPTQLRSFIFQERKRVVFELFGGTRGVVLDVGCGPAVYTDGLVKMGCAIYGVDISPEMIALAKRRQFPGASFSVGNVESLSFPPKMFDGILCVGVLEYTDRSEAAVGEMARVLKPGGRIVVTVPNGDSWLNRLDRSLRQVLRGIHRLSRGRLFRSAITYEYAPVYWPSQLLENTLARHGFQVEQRRFHIFRLTFLNRISPKLSLWIMRKMNFVSSRFLGANLVIQARRT